MRPFESLSYRGKHPKPLPSRRRAFFLEMPSMHQGCNGPGVRPGVPNFWLTALWEGERSIPTAYGGRAARR